MSSGNSFEDIGELKRASEPPIGRVQNREGVGSRSRSRGRPCGSSLPENDSRPRCRCRKHVLSRSERRLCSSLPENDSRPRCRCRKHVLSRSERRLCSSLPENDSRPRCRCRKHVLSRSERRLCSSLSENDSRPRCRKHVLSRSERRLCSSLPENDSRPRCRHSCKVTVTTKKLLAGIGDDPVPNLDLRCQLVRLDIAAGEYVLDGDTVGQQVVADRSPVTLPVQSFGAQDGRAVVPGDFQQLRNVLPKIVGRHVIGTIAEAPVPESAIGGRRVRLFAMATTAKGFEPVVLDLFFLQSGPRPSSHHQGKRRSRWLRSMPSSFRSPYSPPPACQEVGLVWHHVAPCGACQVGGLGAFQEIDLLGTAFAIDGCNRRYPLRHVDRHASDEEIPVSDTNELGRADDYSRHRRQGSASFPGAVVDGLAVCARPPLDHSLERDD
jgi:hypothetical protein